MSVTIWQSFYDSSIIEKYTKYIMDLHILKITIHNCTYIFESTKMAILKL